MAADVRCMQKAPWSYQVALLDIPAHDEWFVTLNGFYGINPVSIVNGWTINGCKRSGKWTCCFV